MIIVRTLRDAIAGWIGIVRGEPGWDQNFRLTPAGLTTALVLFYVFAFLAIVLASFEVGVPTLGGLVEIMLVQSLWILALLLALFGTRYAVRSKGSPLAVLVPGIYAIVLYLIAGTLLSLVLGLLLPLLWLILGYMLFRLGRIAGPWSVGVSAAFAVLAVVLLVGLPMTLYMLSAPAIPAA